MFVLVSCLSDVTQVYAQKVEPARTVLTGTVKKASDGTPLQGATVKLKDANTGVLTNKAGEFTLTTGQSRGIFSISYIGYTTQEIPFDPTSASPFSITLSPDENSMDEVQVIGYGQVSKRFNTGSVVTVKAEDIERQPVSNPLAALAGRVPGMTVTQTSGDSGSKINIEIRGQNSISQGSQPLFIIDGIPFPNDYVGTGDIVSINGGQSPFSNIFPSDIEQIDVLKDADATAIYGSRGANGVVLITTKKGQTGRTKFDASLSQGIGQVTRRMKLLNTQQYVEMRKEAFANDGIEPNAINAPDLVLWDTTRYTDWQDYFIGGTARFTNGNASISGGNTNTQFVLNGNYSNQTTVYPSDFAESRGGGRLNISHTSNDNRLKAILSSSYSYNSNELPGDLTSNITLPPNNPRLLDDNGDLVWSENGGTFANPITAMYRKRTAVTDNFISNVNIQFELAKGLQIRTTGGYNLIQFNEFYLSPKSAIDPNNASLVSSSTFGNTTNKSWIIEPQIEYEKTWGVSRLTALAGATLQNSIKRLFTIDASDFPNDALLGAAEFAKEKNAYTSKTEYRYQAIFGRINYNLNNKYLINITGRRDGSSRFGPNKRISNFGAIGAAWIFNEEDLLRENLTWLTFGKIRGSYGITGNDQIGDYQYLDDYGATSAQYDGQVGYKPSRLFNPDYTWERNKKLELALELGFIENRILLTTNWFSTRSDNQLINYNLPDQTGFPSILRNFGAMVQNSGWEFLLSGNPVRKPSFNWDISFNLTLSKNKLIDFPGLENSSYANTLVIGYPLNIEKYLHWTGVDPTTGMHTFEGTSRPDDQTRIIDFSPRYYGGINNSISFRDFDLSFLFQFTKQNGISYITSFGGNHPGSRSNQPVAVLNRWREEGDITDIQKFTISGTGYSDYSRYSDARVSDASFLRLKTLYFSYTLPNRLSQKAKLDKMKIYLQGQNLFTLTDFKGLDPETGSTRLPPMKMYTIGIQISI